MKAIRFHAFGGPEVLRCDEVPVPTPGQDDVLVRIHAAGVNPVDAKIRSGDFIPYRPGLPAIAGRDVAGVVIRVGARASRWNEGDAVYGMLDYPRGAYADYAIASSREIAPKPARLDYLHAAATPVAALTALQGLHDHGRLRAGERVLIHGAAGGVGHFAVQMAAGAGAEVLVTATKDDSDFLRRLGAVRVIDHRTHRFEDEVGNVDLVFDLVGGETRARSWSVLKAGGRLVTTLGEPAPERAVAADVLAIGMVVAMRPEQLSEIGRRVDEGRLTVHVSRVFPLVDARQAHEHLEHAHIRGKIALTVA